MLETYLSSRVSWFVAVNLTEVTLSFPFQAFVSKQRQTDEIKLI